MRKDLIDACADKKDGFYIIQSRAGDGKTTFLRDLMCRMSTDTTDDYVFLFMHCEYSIHSSPIFVTMKVEDKKIKTKMLPLNHGSLRSVEDLIGDIHSEEESIHRRNKKIGAIFFDDFDTWVVSYSRFFNKNIYEAIKEASTVMNNFIKTKVYPMFVTTQQQRNKSQLLGDSIQITVVSDA